MQDPCVPRESGEAASGQLPSLPAGAAAAAAVLSLLRHGPSLCAMLGLTGAEDAVPATPAAGRQQLGAMLGTWVVLAMRPVSPRYKTFGHCVISVGSTPVLCEPEGAAASIVSRIVPCRRA